MPTVPFAVLLQTSLSGAGISDLLSGVIAVSFFQRNPLLFFFFFLLPFFFSSLPFSFNGTVHSTRLFTSNEL